MKKLILVPVIALFSLSSFAQDSTTGGPYCDLVVYRPFFKNFVAEMHTDGNVRPHDAILKDAKGKRLKFASEGDALNYVVKQGWELVSTYNPNHSETHFVLKKINS